MKKETQQFSELKVYSKPHLEIYGKVADITKAVGSPDVIVDGWYDGEWHPTDPGSHL